MAFTNQNDVNILQASDTAKIGAGAGNDVYVLSPALMSPNQEVQIIDTGVNTLRLVDGMEILSAQVISNGFVLNLSEGRKITVLDSEDFVFQTGGDPLTGQGAESQDFATFVTQTLGLDGVPAPGVMAESGPVVIGQPLANLVQLPVGQEGSIQGGNLDQADVFVFNVEEAKATDINTQISLQGFETAYDSLRLNLPEDVTGSSLADLNGQNGYIIQSNPIDNSTTASFGPDANGDVVTLTLSGVTDLAAVQVEIV